MKGADQLRSNCEADQAKFRFSHGATNVFVTCIVNNVLKRKCERFYLNLLFDIFRGNLNWLSWLVTDLIKVVMNF